MVKFSLKSQGVDTFLEEGGIRFKVSTFIASFVRYFLYSLIVIIALTQLGIQVLSLIFLISILWLVVITSLAFLAIFGTKEILSNVFAGLQLRNSAQISTGDVISIGNLKGKVKKVSFISTQVELGKDEIVNIPNIQFVKESYIILRSRKKLIVHLKMRFIALLLIFERIPFL